MTRPATARRPGAFYGWWMVGLCALAMGMTAPGQTIGVSAFIDELIAALDTNRSTVATAYLVGTLSGAAALPFIGRWIDRVGVRHSMLVVGSAFAISVALTATVQNIVMLTAAFVLLRMLGQGSLHLVGVTGVVMWFERRRGLALAIAGMGAMAMMSLAPLTFSALIEALGWRWSWVALGVIVAAVVPPIAKLLVVDRPDQIGQRPDGPVDASEPELSTDVVSATVGEALRTPAFWTLTALSILAGAVITGLTFHNTDLLGEQGLTTVQASAIFIPQLVGSVSSSFVIGWMTDRFAARPLMVFGGLMLALGTFLATIASPGLMAMLYGLVTGVGIGSISALGGALYPKWFGVGHIGAIRGLASTANVAASAVGPLILSVGNDLADSYVPIVVACAIAGVAVALVAFAVPVPDGPPDLVRASARTPNDRSQRSARGRRP